MKPHTQRRAVLVAAGSLSAVAVLGAGIFIGKLQPMSSQTVPAAAATSTTAPVVLQPRPGTTPTAPTQPSTSRRPATPTPTEEAPTIAPSAPSLPVALPPVVREPEPRPFVAPYEPPPITYPPTLSCPKGGGVGINVTEVHQTRTSGVFDFYQATITVENTTGIPVSSLNGSSAGITFRCGADKKDQSGGWFVHLPEEIPPGRTVLSSIDDDYGISAYYQMDVPITSFRIEGPLDFSNTPTDQATASRYCSWTAKLGKPLVGSWGP